MKISEGLFGNIGTDYNRHGHRCNEMSDINLRNHMLVVGDTAGLCLNLPIEQTFPFLLSKKLNISYYNLSVINGGIDIIKHNLYTWLFKFGLPKYIIVACEYVNSLHVADANLEDVYAADLQDSEIQELNLYANHCGFFTGRNYLNDLLLSHTKGSQIYQLTWENKISVFNSPTNIVCDNMSQLEITNALYTQIQSRIKKVMTV